jgi:hypothetical protein
MTYNQAILMGKIYALDRALTILQVDGSCCGSAYTRTQAIAHILAVLDRLAGRIAASARRRVVVNHAEILDYADTMFPAWKAGPRRIDRMNSAIDRSLPFCELCGRALPDGPTTTVETNAGVARFGPTCAKRLRAAGVIP